MVVLSLSASFHFVRDDGELEGPNTVSKFLNHDEFCWCWVVSRGRGKSRILFARSPFSQINRDCDCY